MTDDTHECPVNDCPERIPFTVLACKRHWFSLPPKLRAEINRLWRSGDLEAYLRTREQAVLILNSR